MHGLHICDSQMKGNQITNSYLELSSAAIVNGFHVIVVRQSQWSIALLEADAGSTAQRQSPQ